MLALRFPRLLRVALPLLAVAALAPTARAQDTTVPDADNPSSEPEVVQTSGLLSSSGGQRLMEEASRAIDAQNYGLAQQRLQQARQVFNQLSNFHQQLAGAFSAIDNGVSQDQRKSALEAAQLRDMSTYQLALVHRAQNQLELAIPLLVQIVGSQSPTRDLGAKAYQQLTELGFIRSSAPNSVTQVRGLLSMPSGQRLMDEASQAIEAQNYGLAQQRLQQARQVFNQLSNFHQQLAGAFAAVDNRVSQDQRKSALEAAEMRDVSTYQLAVVHRAQNQPELAIPLLTQVVGSQSPTRDLGAKAYQQLVELGFIRPSAPRPATGGAAPTPAPAPR